jgi:hypothetical protein
MENGIEENLDIDDVVLMEVEKKMEQDEAEINAAIGNIAKRRREAKKAKEDEETKKENDEKMTDQDEDGIKTPEIKEEELLYKTKSQLDRSPSKLLGVRRLSSSMKSPLIVRSNSLTTLLANNNNLTGSSDQIKELLDRNENLN